MKHFHKGIAPLVLVLLIALGLAGGATAGYTFREPIKKAISGVTTAEEITEAIENFKLGQSKFELEGIVTAVNTVVPAATTAATTTPTTTTSDTTTTTPSATTTPPTTTTTSTTSNTLVVKITSSTNSIENLRLSETPIITNSSTKFLDGSNKAVTFADILINARVHVGGTVKDGILTATKVIIQKEDATVEGEKTNDKFVVSGTVKTISADSITVTASSTNKKAKDKKGQDLEIKIADVTIIEKANLTITLADVKTGDQVQVKGTVTEDVYTAAEIKVKAAEQAGELELEQEQNANQNQGNSDKNKEIETEKNNNANSNNSPNSNTGGNSDKNQ